MNNRVCPIKSCAWGEDCAMIDRRDIFVGSAAALAASLITPSAPAFAQATTVPGTKRGLLERPGCRVYYEITGSGPPLIFAHGLGSSHLTWWQQVPHFIDRYTCVTFAHRGYPPGSEIGVPDPQDFADDLVALIEHLQLPDVRLVAQSKGGWTAIEYILANPQHKVRALVLASTCGTIHKPSIPLADPQRLTEWNERAAAARANTTRPPDVLRGISIPVLFITGGEDTTYPPFLSDALAPLMPNARVEQVPDSGHSVYFQRATVFNGLLDNFLSKVG